MICEKLKTPHAINGFWPVLFDYKGKKELYEIQNEVCCVDGYSVLQSILMDGHNCYGINTISFSRSAFVRKDDVLHSITSYRTPTSHSEIPLVIRVDRPFYQVEVLKDTVNVSLHLTFLEILPTLPFVNENYPEKSEHEGNSLENDIGQVMQSLFSQASIEGENDLCQSLSQVSLEDQERLSQEVEPESKKIKLDPVQPPPNMLPSLRYKELVCFQCGAKIKGGKSKLERHKKTLVQTNLAFQN